MIRMPRCPECKKVLDWFDNIINKSTGKVEYQLFVCQNLDCELEGEIFNNQSGYLEPGDPSGSY